MEEITSASSKSSGSVKSNVSSRSSSSATSVQKHGAVTAASIQNAAAVLKEESFFSKNRNFLIFIGLIALFVAVSVMSSKTNNTQQPPTNTNDTFSYTELVRTLYVPGTDAVGKTVDFSSTTVTGHIHDASDESFENQVSIVVAHSVDELNQPGIQNLMASQQPTRPVVMLMNTSDENVPPHANYSIRKNGSVFMYIPSA